MPNIAPRADVRETTGHEFHEALLAVVIDRLEGFQRGPFACLENGGALHHLRAAQGILLARTRARLARGVEGTHQP